MHTCMSDVSTNWIDTEFVDASFSDEYRPQSVINRQNDNALYIVMVTGMK